MTRVNGLALIVLLAVAISTNVNAQTDSQIIAEIEFEEGSDVIASVGPSKEALSVLARTLALFGNRRDIQVSMIVSEDILKGTIAADRKQAILGAASSIDASARTAVLDLQFSSALHPSTTVLSISSASRASEFCPWTIEMSLNGWTGALEIPAGQHNQLPAPDDLSLGFTPHSAVPYSKSLMECAGAIQVQGTGINSAKAPCRVFLVASTQPIENITLPEIKLALLGQGKGTGAALLPTQLSGTAICDVQLTE